MVPASALSVDGVPVDLAGLDGSAATLAELGFATPPEVDPREPRGAPGDDVVGFDPSSSEQDPRQPATPVQYPPVDATFGHLALSADGTELAGADPDEDGISRWRGTNRYEVPLDADRRRGPVVRHAAAGCGWGRRVDRGSAKARGSGSSTSAPTRPTATRRGRVRSRRRLARRPAGPRVAGRPGRRPGRRALRRGRTAPGTRIDVAGIVRGRRRCAPEPRARRCASVHRSPAPCRSPGSTTGRSRPSGSLDGKTLQPAILSVGGDVRALTPVPRRRGASPPPVASVTCGSRRARAASSDGPARSGSTTAPPTDLAVAAG